MRLEFQIKTDIELTGGWVIGIYGDHPAISTAPTGTRAIARARGSHCPAISISFRIGAIAGFHERRINDKGVLSRDIDAQGTDTCPAQHLRWHGISQIDAPHLDEGTVLVTQRGGKGKVLQAGIRSREIISRVVACPVIHLQLVDAALHEEVVSLCRSIRSEVRHDHFHTHPGENGKIEIEILIGHPAGETAFPFRLEISQYLPVISVDLAIGFAGGAADILYPDIAG